MFPVSLRYSAQAQLGSVRKRDQNATLRELDRCYMHEDFKFPKNDIALLRISAEEDEIEEPKGSQFRYNSICLPNVEKVYESNLTLEIAGWGLKEFDTPTFYLQKATINYEGVPEVGRGCDKELEPPAFYCLDLKSYKTPDTCSASNPFIDC